jgi:hypothetical protein
LPKLEQIQATYDPKDLSVVSIAVDRGHRARIEGMANDLSISFPVLLDPTGKVRKRYEIFALPTTFLLDSNGLILGRIVGERDWTSKKAKALLTRLLEHPHS